MGQSNGLSSLEKLTELTMNSLNEKIKSIDWNKKWKADYPSTEKSSVEIESLKKSDFKETLKEFFDDNSLVMKTSGEV